MLTVLLPQLSGDPEAGEEAGTAAAIVVGVRRRGGSAGQGARPDKSCSQQCRVEAVLTEDVAAVDEARGKGDCDVNR